MMTNVRILWDVGARSKKNPKPKKQTKHNKKPKRRKEKEKNKNKKPFNVVKPTGSYFFFNPQDPDFGVIFT